MNLDRLPKFLFDKLIDVDKNFHKKSIIVKTKNTFNLNIENIDSVINLEKINNFRRINKFHEHVNEILRLNGIYCCCAETLNQRKNRKKQNKNFIIKPILLFFDFIYKRVLPKLPIIKKFYFSITRGYNRVMSKTEIIGRLISCGFEISNIVQSEGLTYIISKKIDKPNFDMNASYGPLFKMKRIGKNGKIISVYKFRTMHPYSEYTQSKLIEENKLDQGGKIFNDYRITSYGKFMRKYWIDELPMIINFIKGDLKIFGVRPLSRDYYSRYPKDLQVLRVKTVPGLIPPFYYDLPSTFEEICDSERKYLNSYFDKPYITDIKYFFVALWNIIVKRKRSR